jgi:hypothetical protein
VGGRQVGREEARARTKASSSTSSRSVGGGLDCREVGGPGILFLSDEQAVPRTGQRSTELLAEIDLHPFHFHGDRYWSCTAHRWQ